MKQGLSQTLEHGLLCPTTKEAEAGFPGRSSHETYNNNNDHHHQGSVAQWEHNCLVRSVNYQHCTKQQPKQELMIVRPLQSRWQSVWM